MLEKGADETVVDGFFKEAEVQFEAYMKEALEKKGGIGGALFKGLNSLRGVGAGLRGMASGEGIVGNALKPMRNYGSSIMSGFREGVPSPAAAKEMPFNGWSYAERAGKNPGGWSYNGIKGTPAGGTHVEYFHPETGSMKVIPTRQAAKFNKMYTEQGLSPAEVSRLGISKAPTTPMAGGKVAYKDPNTGAIRVMQQHEADMLHSRLGGSTPPPGTVAANTAAAASGLSRTARYGMTGAGIGGLVGNVPGAIAGGLLGAGVGKLGLTRTGLLGAGALYGGSKLLGAGGNDRYGLPNDRNRLLPFMNNNMTGLAGGALAGLVASQMGVPGGALLPLAGGVMGYKYLPELMNNAEDPLGRGANSVSYPIMGGR